MKFPSILFILLALFGRSSRVIYDTPSQVASSSLPETIMAQPAKESTWRFSAYVETQPSPGCEYDSTIDLVISWTRITSGLKTPHGLPGWQRFRTTLRKDGHVEGAAIPSVLFHARAGSRISYGIDYSAGRGCKTRPSYQVFPVLEQIKKEKP